MTNTVAPNTAGQFLNLGKTSLAISSIVKIDWETTCGVLITYRVRTIQTLYLNECPNYDENVAKLKQAAGIKS